MSMPKPREEHFDPAPLFAELDEQGRTMKWLGRATGYSRSYVHQVRAGEKPLTETFARKACAAMGLDFPLFFLPVEPPKRVNATPLTATEAAD
jgi:lambda repressor-like predicted transcriptional regulator